MQNPRLMIDGKPTIKCSRKNFFRRFKKYLVEINLFNEDDLDELPYWKVAKMIREYFDVEILYKTHWSNSKDTYMCRMIYMTNDLSKSNIQSLVDSINKNDIQISNNKKKRESLLETRGIDYTDRLIIGNSLSKSFYQSAEWKSIRYQAFDLYGNMCQCCGRTPQDGIVLHVDHVIPRVLKPHLSLNIENLQILCEPCNLGKRADYITDWRA